MGTRHSHRILLTTSLQVSNKLVQVVVCCRSDDTALNEPMLSKFHDVIWPQYVNKICIHAKDNMLYDVKLKAHLLPKSFPKWTKI